MDSPVDVGGFAEPRKILCQCALPSVEQLSVHPRSAHGGDGIPQQQLPWTWRDRTAGKEAKYKLTNLCIN
jgi:hypothetical protein